ncbi:phage/plasmid primase, P4 family [Mesorhizobium sp. M0213]|uniref:phage/plasmid primase, P4 family n=1 Tax=unclassified Mesorhizobium TaxID=325217 RepID=UPI0033374DD3
MTQQPLAVDIDEAERFLNIIDPEATFFTFQTIDDSPKKDPKLGRVLNGSLRQCAPELIKLNKLGAGVFVTINETNGEGRKTEDIVRVRAVFVDLDGAPLDPVLKDVCPPQVVVTTSEGKWHAYWCVEGMELDEFPAAQRKLIAKFDGDEVVKDLPRVMRLPGFYHQKGEPQLVRIYRTWLVETYPARQFRGDPPAAAIPQVVDAADDDNGAAMQLVESECAKVAATPDGSKKRNDNLNKAAFTIGGLVANGYIDEEDARKRLEAAADECGLARKESSKSIQSGLSAGKQRPITPRLILDPTDPMRSARSMVLARYTDDKGLRTLQRHRSTFWVWNGSHYAIADDEQIEADAWGFLAVAFQPGKEGLAPFKPNSARVADVTKALRAAARLRNDISAPAWMDADPDKPASEFMAVKNGLLHVSSGEMWQPTASFFNTSSSEVSFNPDASAPSRWLAFLKQVFVDDQEAIDALQEWFGYTLLPDTSQQKILLIVGPRRSGKGTIARVLTQLLGRDSVAGPTASGLGDTFGLESLIPKPLAIVPDMRIGARTDKSTVAERLLSISGEDTLTVNRKFKDAWIGRLNTRIMILTNEVPAFSDGAGALASRFLVLMMEVSFLGEEDRGLFDKLKTEMAGILNWAMEGYERLRQRGHFIQPSRSEAVVDEMEMLASPARAFVKDCCEVGPGFEVTIDDLFDEWEAWCQRSNIDRAGTKKWFGRNLRTAVPGLGSGDTGTGNERTTIYKGLRLTDAVVERRHSAQQARLNRDAVDSGRDPFHPDGYGR